MALNHVRPSGRVAGDAAAMCAMDTPGLLPTARCFHVKERPDGPVVP